MRNITIETLKSNENVQHDVMQNTQLCRLRYLELIAGYLHDPSHSTAGVLAI